MAKPRKNCPDCDGPLELIQILDGLGNFLGKRSVHVPLGFAAGNANPHNFWGLPAKEAGVLFGMKCRNCGRVLIYGESNR
jgi:hypothetical protein